jgi:hypothetical protein
MAGSMEEEWIASTQKKPDVVTVDSLPPDGNLRGDLRFVVEADAWFMWDGITWLVVAYLE